MSDVKSRRAGLALGLAFFSGMLSSSIPTPLYPLYRSLFHFTASQIMIIFGVYAGGVLLTLCLTSRLKIRTEHYSGAVYLGLCCVGSSSVLMMFATNFEMLSAARFITGVGSGLLMAYVNRSLIKLFSTESSNLAALIASASLVLGQALGPVISGTAVQFQFFALSFPFSLLMVTTLVAGIAIYVCSATINSPVQHEAASDKKTVKVSKDKPAMKDVYVGCSAIFLSWAMASTFMSQGPTLAHSYYGVLNPQVVSYSLSAFLVVAGLTQFLMRRTRFRVSLNTGVMAQLTALLIASVSCLTAYKGLLLMAVLVEGFAYGAILVGAATIVNRMAVQSGRTQLVNVLYIMGYIGNWLPLVLSISMDHFPLKTAMMFYLALCVAVASIIAFFLKAGKSPQRYQFES